MTEFGEMTDIIVPAVFFICNTSDLCVWLPNILSLKWSEKQTEATIMLTRYLVVSSWVIYKQNRGVCRASVRRTSTTPLAVLAAGGISRFGVSSVLLTASVNVARWLAALMRGPVVAEGAVWAADDFICRLCKQKASPQAPIKSHSF